MTPPETLPEAGSARRLGVRILVDRMAPRRWHCDLLDDLAALPGVSPNVVFVEGANPLPASADLLFKLERLVYRTAAPTFSVEVAPSDFARHRRETPAVAADLVIDLSGNSAGGPTPSEVAGRVWRLTYDGGTGEASLLAALLAGWAPLAEIWDGDRLVASGRLGTEYQGIAGLAFEDALCRTITLLCRAVLGEVRSRPLAAPMADPSRPPPPAIDRGRIGRIAAKTVARAIVRQLYHLAVHSPQWRVGWRIVEGGADAFDLQRLPDAGWRDLSDDGLRFYADPFPIEHRGRMFLFVEDYAHRLGKGIVSAVEFGPDGPIGRPEPVLETPFHLSYPFVFEAEGEAWMIPESSAGGTVDLFRATNFPGGWVKEATLLSGIAASDATLLETDGRWWMFATVRDRGGAFSDALHLWSAPSFRGPFVPHAGNPVLIDSASVRPAGRIVRRNGAFWRPVQDCRRTYGGALGLARIDRLDDEAYAQTVSTILRPGTSWPGHRLHTLNRAGSLEFIDGSGRPPRRF